MKPSFFRTVSLVTAMSLLLIGCNSKQADSTKQEAQKELSVSEVAKKVDEVTSKYKGTKSKVSGTFGMKFPGMSVETKVSSVIEETLNPSISHEIATLTLMGKNVKTETYTDEKWTYEKDPFDNKWYKYNDPMMSESLPAPIADDINKLGAQIDLMGLEAATISHANGIYTISFDSSKSKDKEKLKKFAKEVFGEEMAKDSKDKSSKEAEQNFDMFAGDPTIKSLNETYSIDEKTFEIKNAKVSVDLSANIIGEEAGMKIDMDYEFLGSIDTPIQIPANILKAPESKLDEIDEASSEEFDQFLLELDKNDKK